MRVSLSELLDHAEAATREAWHAIVGPVTIVDNRSQILLAYVSVAMEHQEAIVLLARQRLYGSALALVRSVYEILYRAAWIYSCAKPDDVTRIWEGRFDFPKMGDIVAAIDATSDTDFFQRFKALSWRDQNDFTHTGRLQIHSRFSGGELESRYPDEMIMAQVSSATMAAILGSCCSRLTDAFQKASVWSGCWSRSRPPISSASIPTTPNHTDR
jgi:hypothetical protein